MTGAFSVTSSRVLSSGSATALTTSNEPTCVPPFVVPMSKIAPGMQNADPALLLTLTTVLSVAAAEMRSED